MEDNTIQTNTAPITAMPNATPTPPQNTNNPRSHKKAFTIAVVAVFIIIIGAALYIYKKRQIPSEIPAIPTDDQIKFLQESKKVIDQSPEIPKDKKLEILKANLETQ